jgi:hypothetical protein
MNSKNAIPREREVTQDIGFAAVAKPTMLWIGQEGQYKSPVPFVKMTHFKTACPKASGWT